MNHVGARPGRQPAFTLLLVCGLAGLFGAACTSRSPSSASQESQAQQGQSQTSQAQTSQAQTSQAQQSAESPTAPHDVVVITTDDQTLESLRVMRDTSRLFNEQGTTFSDAVVSFPVCCPSRATWLTGRYAHNHGVRDNVAPLGGVEAFDPSDTVATRLADVGYRTVFIGKYLNGYGRFGHEPAPGWSSWDALIDPSTYSAFDYDISRDGELVHYGRATSDYQTDVLANIAIDRITSTPAGQPLFVSVNFHVPHGANAESSTGTLADEPPEPAPRHVGAFASEPLPPQLLTRGTGPYPAPIANVPALDSAAVATITRRYRAELESLLAVDEAVYRIVVALGRTGRLSNTVLLFTSDNGTFHGEHGLAAGKYYPYEPAIRVPLLARGPGFRAGATVDAPVANVDLAPTILLAAGIADPQLDGVALQRSAAEPDAAMSRALLLEGKPMDHVEGQLPGFVGVRTHGWTYVRWADGFEEAYDLTADPQQQRNLASTSDLTNWRSLAERLATCRGSSCVVETGDRPSASVG